MTTGIVLLNFGEPESPTPELVIPFLERIFNLNASLEQHRSEEAARARSRQLAEERAPGLIEEYKSIGGSPLYRQALGQARDLAGELSRRGHEVKTYVGHQFAEPLIGEAVRQAREDGVDLLIGLPVYPLCGPTTTIAALRMMRAEVDELGWEVPVAELSGWHQHPNFTRIWADSITDTVNDAGIDLADPTTALVFSVHGTPLKYIEEGSRYVQYAEEACAMIAEAVGMRDYRIGYQNHTNRPLAWTPPDIDEVILGLDARDAVVVPIAFMREQSETLAELDDELREIAEGAGLGFHRVPVPHNDPDLAELLADLVEPLITGTDPAEAGLQECACRPGALCPRPQLS